MWPKRGKFMLVENDVMSSNSVSRNIFLSLSLLEKSKGDMTLETKNGFGYFWLILINRNEPVYIVSEVTLGTGQKLLDTRARTSDRGARRFFRKN